MTEFNEKPLHEVVEEVIINCFLQIRGIDVAIPYLIGAPGAGKTESIKSMVKRLDSELLSTHLALKPIEEIGGIPKFADIHLFDEVIPGTVWTCPDILKPLFEMSERLKVKTQSDKKDRFVIWLIDDAHLLGPGHMALLYETLTERTLRGYKLPKNVAIIMAGNAGSSKAGSKTMFSAIVNRVAMFRIFADFMYWKAQFAIPNRVHPAIISFLNQDHYRRFFHEDEQIDQPWCSPRSWTRASNMISAKEAWTKKVLPTEILLYLMASTVGNDAAAEFTSYYQIYSKFNVPEILKNHENFKVPTEPMDQYALAYSIINFYIGKPDRSVFVKPISRIIEKYSKNQPELAVMMLQEVSIMERSLNIRNLATAILEEIQKGENPKCITDLLQETVEA